MTKEIYIFIAALLLLLPVMGLFGDLSLSAQLLISSPFIFLLGIPHGAIDNVLYLRGKKGQNLPFIGVYLLIIGFNILLWVFIPVAAYLLFLMISAYHFGQSQFSHYFKKQALIHQIFYMAWGICILSALIFFNLNELQALTIDFQEFEIFSLVHRASLLETVFLVSSALTLFIGIFLLRDRSFKREDIFMEALILILILVTFYLMPIILGFTLYFVILHSFKVLREEYEFLKKDRIVKSYLSFVKLLTPFSILSLFGLGFLFLAIHFEVLKIPYGYCILIMISSITLPHVFVMDAFYKLLFKNQFYQS